MIILIFGTSTTRGAYDSEGGWVSRLDQFIKSKRIKLGAGAEYYRPVYNLGIDGNRSADILNRFDNEVRARFEPSEALVIIFELGANDAAWLNNENTFWISPDEFRDNLGMLIGKARQYTSNIFFLGIHPTDDRLSDPVSWDSNLSYKAENFKKYNEIVKRFCAEEKIDFIDTLSVLERSGGVKLLFDGLHPNDEGHRLIFESVKEHLAEKGIC